MARFHESGTAYTSCAREREAQQTVSYQQVTTKSGRRDIALILRCFASLIFLWGQREDGE